MIKVTFKSWDRANRASSSELNTLKRLDCYNKTKYAKKKNLKEILPEVSSFFHNERKIYFVTIYDNDKPINFIEINNDFVLVGFLDEQNREYMNYVFYEVEPKKLFLKKVQYWEYVGATSEKKLSERYSFTQEGELTIEEADILNNIIETKKATNKVDVSSNYEVYPDFGKYESLIKKERNLF